MLKEITGDLIVQASEFDVILHGCNCFCTMGGGIAATIAKTFPEAQAIDNLTKRGDKSKLGRITFTENTSPIIVNCYTQFGFSSMKTGPAVDYVAIKNCMREVKKQFTGKKIGLPLIGAGLAGGDFDIIRLIIREELKDEDVTIVIWDKN